MSTLRSPDSHLDTNDCGFPRARATSTCFRPASVRALRNAARKDLYRALWDSVIREGGPLAKFYNPIVGYPKIGYSCRPMSNEGDSSIIEDLRSRKQALTAKELAELLSVTPRHVYRLARDFRIPRFRIGDSIRFDPKAIACWLQRRHTPAIPRKRSSRYGTK